MDYTLASALNSLINWTISGCNYLLNTYGLTNIVFCALFGTFALLAVGTLLYLFASVIKAEKEKIEEFENEIY
jgi:hypothetical protein